MPGEVHGSVKNAFLLFVIVYIYAEALSTFVYSKPIVEIKSVQLRCFETKQPGLIPAIQLGLQVQS